MRLMIRPVLTILTAVVIALSAPAEDRAAVKPLPPFPRVQAIPEPDGEVAFTIDGETVAKYQYDAAVGRPFVYPFVGPAGRGLTRIGHPHDPHGHRHHRSIWITHVDVGGVNFWADTDARIVQEAIQELTDGEDRASATVLFRWEDRAGKA